MMLRPLETEQDLIRIYEIVSSPLVTALAGAWDKPVPLPVYLEAKKKSWGVVSDGFQLAVVDGDTIVGVANVSDMDMYHRRAHVGIVIDPQYQGQGYGTHAIRALVELCFMDIGLTKLYAEVYPFNEGSKKVFERAGFIREGVLVGHDFRNGIRQDVILYGLCKGDVV